jgi:hypothetical protein
MTRMNSQKFSDGKREKYVALLKSLGAVLSDNGHEPHSRIVLQYAEQIAAGTPPSLLTTYDMWGGSGSVADCTILQGPSPSTASASDEQKFCTLLVDLADLMIEDGIATALVESRRKTFAIWAGRS